MPTRNRRTRRGKSLHVEPLQQLQNKINSIVAHSEEIVDGTLAKGAGKAADLTQKGIDDLRIQETADGNAPWIPVEYQQYRQLYGVTTMQKEDLTEGLGIAPFDRRSNMTDTHIGFDGYSRTFWSKGKDNKLPNAVLARAVASGTAFRAGTDFDMKYIQGNGGVEKIEKAFEEGFMDVMKQFDN